MKVIAKFTLIFFLISNSVSTYAQETKQYEFTQKEGYYVNLKGEKIYGLILYMPPYSHNGLNKSGYIEYKSDKKAKKEKIKPEECKEFVVDEFRFIQCLYPLQVKNGIIDQTIESDFLHVIAEGSLSLYLQYTIFINQSNPSIRRMGYSLNMIVKKEGDKRYLRLPDFEKRRDAFLKELFPGDQEVIEIFYQRGPNKILAALDAYNVKHKKQG